jgi:hypothetical protein
MVYFLLWLFCLLTVELISIYVPQMKGLFIFS